jgi:hypothetical protein
MSDTIYKNTDIINNFLSCFPEEKVEFFHNLSSQLEELGYENDTPEMIRMLWVICKTIDITRQQQNQKIKNLEEKLEALQDVVNSIQYG